LSHEISVEECPFPYRFEGVICYVIIYVNASFVVVLIKKIVQRLVERRGGMEEAHATRMQDEIVWMEEVVEMECGL
jgi:hypothetical protein